MRRALPTAIVFLTLVFLITFVFVGKALAGNKLKSPLLIQKLSERFGVDQKEVEEVFDEVYREHLREIRRFKEDRLNQAVKDGVITEDQKDAIISKMDELIEKRQKERKELEDWFKEQGIDIKKLGKYIGFRRHYRTGKMGLWH